MWEHSSRHLDSDNADDLLSLVEKVSSMFPEAELQCADFQTQTEKLYNKALHKLNEKQKTEADQTKDDEKLKALEDNAKTLLSRHNDLELQLRPSDDDNFEDAKTKADELEKLLRQKEMLQSIESNLTDISDDFQSWQDFQWSEEAEGELNKYGMISSLAIPSFPAGLIKDPALLQQLQARVARLKELRRRVEAEEQRMKEINLYLEEMEAAQRERELRRLADQSKNWIKDFVPSGSAMFGSQPTFRSDFTVDPEEARAAAASRKASRIQSRESSVTPLETIGKDTPTPSPAFGTILSPGQHRYCIL